MLSKWKRKGVFCNCGELIKAIDNYIAKADNDLSEQLSDAGYVDTEESVANASVLEDDIADILNEQTDEIIDKLKNEGDWKKAKKVIATYFANDDATRNALADVFQEYYEVVVPSLATSYIKTTAGDMVVNDIRQRTSSWIEDWSEELGNLMQLTSEQQMGTLVQSAINNGESVADLTRKLMEDRVRNEEWRARRAAITEMLRSHSVAQQEAFMQSPVVSGKKWKHSGYYKTVPRANHVAMDGQVVPKDKPYELTGADGVTYYPMCPRDSVLPAKESVNCGCISQPVVDDDVLGMSLEERQKLQQEIIYNDNGEWEKELDAKNKAKAGITEYESTHSRSISHTNTKAADKWAKTHLGVKKTNYTKQSLASVNKVNRALQRLYKEYPDLNGFIDEVRFVDGLGSDAARATIGKTGNKTKTVLKISKTHFESPKIVNTMIKQQVAEGNWTPKRGVYGILKHEIVHMKTYKAALDTYSDVDDAWKAIDKMELCTSVKVDALKACKLDDTDVIIKRKLGTLACKNADEFVAEAISSSRSSKLTKKVIELFNERTGD